MELPAENLWLRLKSMGTLNSGVYKGFKILGNQLLCRLRTAGYYNYQRVFIMICIDLVSKMGPSLCTRRPSLRLVRGQMSRVFRRFTGELESNPPLTRNPNSPVSVFIFFVDPLKSVVRVYFF